MTYTLIYKNQVIGSYTKRFYATGYYKDKIRSGCNPAELFVVKINGNGKCFILDPMLGQERNPLPASLHVTVTPRPDLAEKKFKV